MWLKGHHRRKHGHDPTQSKRNEYTDRTYGVTREQYDKMLAEQGGACAICRSTSTRRRPKAGTVDSFCIDHDHKTGRVRALLCFRCNAGLGLLDDNTDRLRAALAYLERYQCV
jgi:hypothetical protein